MKIYEEIRNCFEAIKNNIITCNEIDHNMVIYREYNDWLNAYKKRSIAIREIYKKNSEIVVEINNYLEKELTDEIANSLYEGYRSLEEKNLHDSYLIISIIDKLTPYYEKTIDYEKLLHLYTDRCYEVGCFLRLDDSSLDRLKKDFYRIKDIRKHYRSLASIKERRLIYVAYYNIIKSLPEYSSKYNEEIIPAEFKKEKITVSIDKAELKKYLKEWNVIEWARIEERQNLQIK